MYICVLLLKFAQRNGRAAGENPESWIHVFSKGEHEAVEGVRPVCHVIERGRALLTIQQHAEAFRIRVDQHGLTAVVPSRQLDIKPLDTPGLGVAAQSAGRTFAVNAAVSQTDADEIVAAQSDFPVVAPPGETLRGEHLGADSKAFGAVRVASVLIRHRGLSEALTQYDAFVGRLWIQSEYGAIWTKQTKRRPLK